jgi:hypothetical protein
MAMFLLLHDSSYCWNTEITLPSIRTHRNRQTLRPSTLHGSLREDVCFELLQYCLLGVGLWSVYRTLTSWASPSNGPHYCFVFGRYRVPILSLIQATLNKGKTDVHRNCVRKNKDCLTHKVCSHQPIMLFLDIILAH